MRQFGLLLLIFAFVSGTRSASAAATPVIVLSQTPFTVAPGQNVTLFGTLPPGTALPVTLQFGDGRAVVFASLNIFTTHAYERPGFYDCQVVDSIGRLVALAGVEVFSRSPRLPLGTIISTFFDSSPALAGSSITLRVQYRIATGLESFDTLPPSLQLLVELSGADGHVVRRSDPVLIGDIGGMDVNTAVLPFLLPPDAQGLYTVRVFIQAVDRGTIAVSEPITLAVIGHRDDTTVHGQGVHVVGDVLVGHYPNTRGQTITPGISLFGAGANRLLGLGVATDPVSRRVDPLASDTSLRGDPGFSSPDATYASSTVTPLNDSPPESRPQYAYRVGRTTTDLPDLLGGYETMRGADFGLAEPSGWHYHVALGNPQIFTTLGGRGSSSEQFADVLEAGKTWRSGASVSVVHHGRGDNGFRFPRSGPGSEPEIADVTAVVASQPFGNFLSASAAAGYSASHPVIAPELPFSSDWGDWARLRYVRPRHSATISYFNIGPFFAPSAGMQGMSDRAGLSASANASLSSQLDVEAHWTQAMTRSVAARQTTGSLAWTYHASNGAAASLRFWHDHVLTDFLDADSDVITADLSAPLRAGVLVVDGSLVSSGNALNNRAETTSTQNIQYLRQHGMRSFAFGIDARQRTGFGQNVRVAETLSEGIEFGSAARPFALQASLTNLTARSPGVGTDVLDLSGLITYHVTARIMIGFQGERVLGHLASGPSFPGDMSGGEHVLLSVAQ